MLQLTQFQFLPPDHIVRAFNLLKATYAHLDVMHPVSSMLSYFERQWVFGSFPAESWSQFGCTIRTNNGVEGFHKTFNDVIGRKPHLYRFIVAIASDAQRSSDDIAANDFRRDCRPQQARRDQRIQDLQRVYTEKQMRVDEYLMKCARIYRPKKFTP